MRVVSSGTIRAWSATGAVLAAKPQVLMEALEAWVGADRGPFRVPDSDAQEAG